MEYGTIVMRMEILERYGAYLKEREDAPATVEKYVRDVRTFLEYLGEEISFNKERLMAYKSWLLERYAVSSVNSMLVALNQFLEFVNLGRMKLKRVKVQRQHFNGQKSGLTCKEYKRLIFTARRQGKEQLAMIMETIGATGIRISELTYFRVEALSAGQIKVGNKGKYRTVLLPEKLRKKLCRYVKEKGIKTGAIFVTRNGKEKNRSNIWKEMKALAALAKVKPEKIFPHNLRHLFARAFYKATKNLANLADILGHSSLEVTRIYTYENVEVWRKNIEKLNLFEE